MNQLHVVPLNEGLRRKKALWRPAGRKELESIALAPWASRRRQDLLDLLDQLTPKIQELTRALEEEVEKRPVTRRGAPCRSLSWFARFQPAYRLAQKLVDTADIVRDAIFRQTENPNLSILFLPQSIQLAL